MVENFLCEESGEARGLAKMEDGGNGGREEKKMGRVRSREGGEGKEKGERQMGARGMGKGRVGAG